MELTAVFESWLIQDGDYPPFYKGMLVNLAFEMQVETIKPVKSSQSVSLTHLGGAEYDFCGELLRVYGGGSQKKILGMKIPPWNKKPEAPSLGIISSGDVRFYIESNQMNEFTAGDRIRGKGTLLIDCFTWTEYINKRSNPPDIFFSFEVARIRMVEIPERFIYRHEKGKSHPTRVSPADFGDITELETMDGQKGDEEFYLVDFKPTDRRDIPRTFLA